MSTVFLTLSKIEAVLNGVKALSPCSEQVGALLLNPLTGEYVVGYNHNSVHRLCGCEDEHGETLPTVVHAEKDAFNQAQKLFTLDEISRMWLFTCRRACVKCSEEIKHYQIKGVFYNIEQPDMRHIDQLKASGVTVIDYSKERERVEELLKAGHYVLH